MLIYQHSDITDKSYDWLFSAETELCHSTLPNSHAFQGQIQDLKLGVVQMDWKILKVGGRGVLYRYI